MERGEYEATLNQCGLYTVHTLGGHFATSTNVCFQIDFDGPLDVDAFRRGFGRLARANDAFRTSFHRRGRTLVARVTEAVELPCTEHDLRALDPETRARTLFELTQRDASEPFDLSKAPLARLQIAWTGERRGVALFAFHHIVVDGSSAVMLWRGLCDAYRAIGEGKPDDGPPNEDQMSDFAIAEASVRDSDAFRGELERWRAPLAGSLAFPTVTLGTSVPAHDAPFGIEAMTVLSPETQALLRAMAKRHRTTPFVVTLAAVKALVARLTGVDDGIVFSTFANRKTCRAAIGYLVNTLPLRDAIDPRGSFTTLVGQVDRTVRAAREGAHVPFSYLARELMPPESGAPFPLLNVLVDSPPAEYEELARAEANGVKMHLASTRSPLASQLAVSVYARSDAFKIAFRYAGVEDDRMALDALAGAFGVFFEGLLAAPDAPLASIALTRAEEREALVALGQGAPLLEPATLVADRMRAAAVRTPEALAYVGGGERLDYRALLQRIDAAAKLLEGALPDRFVLVATTGHSAAMAVLAALHLGVPWICVDPTQGRARIGRALDVCKPGCVVVDDASRALFAGTSCALVEGAALASAKGGRSRVRVVRPDDLAYAVLTSGTTGEPKLVAIEHRALATQIAALLQTDLFGAAPTMALLAPLTFDASLEQLFVPLVTGGRVVVPAPGVLADPSRAWAMLESEGVTVFDAIPSLLRAMLPSAPATTTITRFVLGGEALPVALARDVRARFPDARVFDTYGPTETTINATYGEADGRRAAIGRPLPSFRAYVVDRERALLPRGLVGQLVLAGPCLARAYLGDEGPTASAFVTSAFDERVYLTGDRVRWGDDGRLVSFGRTDGQVKIRGVRIDLHEVERGMLRLTGALDVVALRHETNRRARLAVVYVPGPDTPGRRDIRARLAAELPRAMVPDVLVPVSKLPRSTSGKLDTLAIGRVLDESAPAPSSTAIRISPHERETTICSCMRMALGLDVTPSADDDFFELGGDSLALIAFLAHLAAEGLLVGADDVRDARHARALARVARSAPRTNNTPLTLEEAERALLPLASAFAERPRKVLLTGATGLFGIHLLDALRSQTSADILCLVRGEDDAAAEERLREAWTRAFGIAPFPEGRVTAVAGDIRAGASLGLSRASRMRLDGVDTVIHAAAHVGWLADRDLLEATNVAGSENVAKLALELKARFHYVSTASVAYADARELPYVASKVRAERAVLAVGAPTRIRRVGLLAGRFSDGAFPLAAYDDSGLLLLLASLVSGAVPVAPGAAIELTPVDACAAAMTKLLLAGEAPVAIEVLKHDRPFALDGFERLRSRLAAPTDRRLPANVAAKILASTVGAARDPLEAATTARLDPAWPVVDDAYVERFLAAAARSEEPVR